MVPAALTQSGDARGISSISRTTAPRCGARTRGGSPCRQPAMKNGQSACATLILGKQGNRFRNSSSHYARTRASLKFALRGIGPMPTRMSIGDNVWLPMTLKKHWHRIGFFGSSEASVKTGVAAGAFAFGLIATPVAAQTAAYSGYELSAACGSPDPTTQTFCATYLIGVFDTANAVMALQNRSRLFCNRPTDPSELRIMYSRYAREGSRVTLTQLRRFDPPFRDFRRASD